FTRGSAPVPLPPFHHLSFLLTHTRVPRDTRRLVEHVRSLTEEYPAIIHPILDAIHAISQRCERASTTSPEEFHACLEKLIDMNQALLNALGTGHPALDRIVALTTSFGCHSKLTGAGGGGCSLTLLPPSHDKDASSTEAAMHKALEEQGFPSWQVDIAGPGVRAMPYTLREEEDDDAVLSSLLTTPPASTAWRSLHPEANV
ncbi:GHMP kinase, partial [Piptocephalis cylindrospora]